MLRKLPIYMLLLLISACSSQEQKTQAPAEQEQVELLFAEHWQLSYFDEQVFNSKVAVLEAGRT